MIDALTKFINLASRSFGKDLEKRHTSQALLTHQLSEDQRLMDDASARMESADRRPKWMAWTIPVVLILAGLLVVLVPACHLYRSAGILGNDSLMGIPLPAREYEPWSYYFDELSEKDRLLLFGDTDLADEVSRREAFWKSEPDNAGAYVEYLSYYRIENGGLPEDMLEVAHQLDPDNALFYLFQAGELSDECTERVNASKASGRSGRSRKGRRGATAPAAPAVTRSHVAIKDVSQHRRALALLHQAAVMPKCTNYGSELMLRRLPLLQREDHDWLSRILPVVYLASQPSHSMPLMKVSRVIRAEAYRCEQEKDAEALPQLVADWMAYCRHIHSASQTLVDGLVLRAAIHAPCRDFAAAAKACEFKQLENYFTGLDQQMGDEKIARNKRAKAGGWGAELDKEGSLLLSMSLPVLAKQVNDVSSIPPLDTRPDRFADHAFWNRISAAVQWSLLLLVGLIAGLWRYGSNVLLRKLGHRLACVFSWRDWAYVALWGVMAPAGYYWLVNGVDTAISVQRYNLTYSAMKMPAGQSGGLMLLLVLAPMLALSYRLKKVLPVQAAPAPRMIWAALVLVLVSMPLFGWAGVSDHGLEGKIKLGLGFQGLALLLLLATPFVAMIRKSRERQYTIGKAVRRQLMIRAYLLASLIMALHVPVYHALEKHWVAEDEIFKLSSEFTSFTMHETYVTKQLLKEMEDLLKEVSLNVEKCSP